MMELKAKHPKMVMKNPVQRTGGGIEQVQADWTQTDETAVDYIKNKPDVFRFEIRGNLAVAEEDFPINLTCDTPAQEIVDAFNNGKELEPVLINTAYDKEKQFFGGFFTFNNTSFSYNLFQLFYFAPSNSQKFTKYKIVQKKDVWQITAREIVLTPIPAYENKNTIQLLASKPNWLYAPQWVEVEDLVEPQIQADWEQTDETAVDFIKNKPTTLSAFENDVGFVIEEEKPTYNLHFVQWSASPAGGKFEFDTVPEDFQQVKELIINGKINLTRTFDLTYDPTTTLPADYATFPDYEFVGVSKLNNMVKIYKYQRIICFSGDKPILDTISFYMRDDMDTYWIYHTYIPLFQAIIIVNDSNWKTQPYPHAITFSSADNLWGKTNLANVKKAMAGFSSKFQFKLRVLTHGDNVWLDPVETISAGSLPRFIGESEKLGKRIIVSFDDFTDDDNPTGTIDMEDLPHAQIQADWTQTDATALDYIKNKPTAVSVFENDAGYLTAHQDISGKANKAELTAHTGNTTIHITANERTYWNGKVNSADLATVATSGSYNDLSNKPTIPTDAHINSLIDTKLGVVENGTY